ncbi:MAG: hypothetical protein Q4C88_03370 [Akkermansia sp.]|nr:hypothetical protein [Akkermansia sp.]
MVNANSFENFPGHAIIPKIDWLNCIPDFCYENRSSQVHEINKWKIPVYIFENHAAAIKAWYKHRETHPALITFDEHADTFPPLWRQREDYLECPDEKQINDNWLNLLKLTRDRIDTIDVEDFFRKGTILRSDSQGQVFNLYYDEQILTAIYLDIIGKAYICAPDSFNPKPYTDIKEIIELYNNVHYLNGLLKPSISSFMFPGHGNLVHAIVNLAECLHQDLRNDTLAILQKFGYGMPDNYILDIDLDYFQNPFFESMPYKEYMLFFDLVRNARAITIATEGECVDASSRNYNSSVEEYNIYAQKYNFEPLPMITWTSKDALEGVLSLIEYELSGQRDEQDEKCRKFDEENDLRLAKNRKKNNLPS